MPINKMAVINCLSSKINNILEIVEPHCSSTILIPMDDANDTSFDGIDGVIISGGPLLFTDKTNETTLIKKFHFITDLKVPTLGICLGHQAIGLMHGAECYRGPERRETDSVRIHKSHPLVENLDTNPIFREDHCEGITLPQGFDLIGSSQHYEVEMMASLHKPFFGVQFHPEASGEPGEVLIRNFLKIVTEYKME